MVENPVFDTSWADWKKMEVLISWTTSLDSNDEPKDLYESLIVKALSFVSPQISEVKT